MVVGTSDKSRRDHPADSGNVAQEKCMAQRIEQKDDKAQGPGKCRKGAQADVDRRSQMQRLVVVMTLAPLVHPRL